MDVRSKDSIMNDLTAPVTIAVFTGGRFTNVDEQWWPLLDAVRKRLGITEVWHGACPIGGADEGAERWAIAEGIPVERFPAPWSLYDRTPGLRKGGAGPRRIDDMLAGRRGYKVDGRGRVVTTEQLERVPEIVVAFPGGQGTRRTVRAGAALGMPVVYVQREPQVLNRHHYPPPQGLPDGAIYIGRGTPLGNPNPVPPAKERKPGEIEANLAAYKRHLWARIVARDPAVLRALDEIGRDSFLVCSCKKPDGTGPCHGDIVVAAWRWMRGQALERRLDAVEAAALVRGDASPAAVAGEIVV